MPRGLWLLLMLKISSSNGIDYHGYRVWRVPTMNLSSLSSLEVLGSAVEGTVDLMVDPARAGHLEESGLAHEELASDLGRLLQEETDRVQEKRRRWDNGTRDRAGKEWVDFDLDNFHTHEEIGKYLHALEERYSFVSVVEIGKSFEGRSLKVLRICRDGCHNKKKKIMWIDAGIHAREWISPATALYLIHRLAEDLPRRDRHLLELDWHFLPSVNPDGYAFTWSEERMWRKTRSRFLGTSGDDAGDCVGTDANRNFDYGWGGPGSGGEPCSWSYRGHRPWSEPETLGVRNYLLSLGKGRVVFYQSLHSYGQMALLPWGCAEEETTDVEDQMALANRAVAALKHTHGSTYSVGPVYSTLYAASGASVDWAYGRAGIKYAYTLELRPGKESFGFLCPPEQIKPTGEEVFAFHASMARDIIKEYLA